MDTPKGGSLTAEAYGKIRADISAPTAGVPAILPTP